MEDHSITSSPQEKYEQQLNDIRWKFKADNIRIRDKHQCRLCGAKDIVLDVHHIRYIYGRALWDYDDGDLVTLCRKCHDRIHDELNFESLERGDYFYNKGLKGVGIVESKQSDGVWFRACWTEDKHYHEDNHGRLYEESEAFRDEVRPAKPQEIIDFWEKVEKYYSIDFIIFYFGTHLRNLLPADHSIRVKARERFKEKLVLFEKQRGIIKERFNSSLLVSEDNYAIFKNQRETRNSDRSDMTLPCAYFHVASKKNVKEKPQQDNSKNIAFEDFDFTGYRAATLAEENEWREYTYHLDCLHNDDLPF